MGDSLNELEGIMDQFPDRVRGQVSALASVAPASGEADALVLADLHALRDEDGLCQRIKRLEELVKASALKCDELYRRYDQLSTLLLAVLINPVEALLPSDLSEEASAPRDWNENRQKTQ